MKYIGISFNAKRASEEKDSNNSKTTPAKAITNVLSAENLFKA